MPQNSPKVGDVAPDFTLPDENNNAVHLGSHHGKSPVVIYFYPKADTPGCTKEACGFRDAIAGYRELGVPVFGISPDPVADVKKFSEKFQLNFPLLADADHGVTERYGCWVQKTMYGKTYMGAARTTFIINKQGQIAHVFEQVNAEGHDQEVLEWLRSHPDA
jgi:thioredoxin-dependent peroxiredoxin